MGRFRLARLAGAAPAEGRGLTSGPKRQYAVGVIREEAGTPMSPEEEVTAALFDRWERVWHGGEFDLIPSCVAPSYVRHDHLGDRTDRVGCRVSPQHYALVHALEASLLDVLALEDLDHRRPHHADDRWGHGQGEREHGQDPLVPVTVTGVHRREQIEPARTEQQDQQNTDHELGDGGDESNVDPRGSTPGLATT